MSRHIALEVAVRAARRWGGTRMHVCPVCRRGDGTTRLRTYWRTLSPEARAGAPHLARPALDEESWAAPFGLLTVGCALLVSGVWLGFLGLAGGGVWLVFLRGSVARAARQRADWRRRLFCLRCHHVFLP